MSYIKDVYSNVHETLVNTNIGEIIIGTIVIVVVLMMFYKSLIRKN